MSDLTALNWLDKLLAAGEEERAASLSRLAHSEPELCARLKQLLASALSPELSRALAQPVLEGVFRLNEDAAQSLEGGAVLGGYRLIRELGRGGMAVVWLAERADGTVRREVALKMPMFVLQSEVDIARFARERNVLAALSHPNVARLYDAGVLPSGQPFLVIERVDGEPINVYCDARKLDVPARLRLFFQILAAVEHAHQHLVVHRDLKPSNILVDGEGQVKLLDFGIAKLLGETEATAPLTQQVGGAMTPLYAAPEQIRGAPISTLTDVYALGVLLHELLTGAFPYRAANGARPTLVDVLEAFARGALPRASQANIDEAAAIARRQPSAAKLRAALTGDLDTIISKAMRIAPIDRYGSAAHFAEDLRRFFGHKPIAARRPSFWYTTRLALVRHRVAAAVAAVGALLVLGAAMIAWQQYRESRAHAERTAAVRDFMFDLVNDAEADDAHGGGEVTGRQMVDGAVRRARADFTAQPQLQGELLGELGRMYNRLGAPEKAVPVLEQAVAILEKHAPAADPALNKSRVFLADALLKSSDDLERVGALATQARAACASTEVDCAKARAYAGNILSQLASFRGDNVAALAAMRQSARDTEFGFGTAHEETAMALMSVAIIARNSGQLVEADTAMRRAVAIADKLRMRIGDRIGLERTMAVIDYDLGHYQGARARLVSLTVRTADPRERALQWRILANVYVDLGEGAQALRAADAAIDLISREKAADLLPFALQARARALSLLDRHDEALTEIDRAMVAMSAAGRAPESSEMMRARRVRAELLLRAGNPGQALEELTKLRAGQQGGAMPAVDAGLVLDMLGAAQLATGDARAALASHEAAHQQLANQLPEGHPYLLRNAALRAAAARLVH